MLFAPLATPPNLTLDGGGVRAAAVAVAVVALVCGGIGVAHVQEVTEVQKNHK